MNKKIGNRFIFNEKTLTLNIIIVIIIIIIKYGNLIYVVKFIFI